MGAASLRELCTRIAAREPVPGAGSGIAAQAALGAALVSMAFRRSSDEGASDVPAYMNGRAQRLDVLAEGLVELADRDAEAYAAFLDARNAPADGEASQAKRQAALERAARAAVEVPFEILEAALAGLRLAAVGAPDQHPNLACETEAGARGLHAAVRSAARVVAENLPIAAAESAEFAAEHERALPALLAEAERLLEEVCGATAPRDADPPSTSPEPT